MKNVKWTSIIPLIGGFPLGAKEATGNYPVEFISYEPFKNNDSHILNYWKKENIPYKVIDSEDFKDDIEEVDLVVMTPPCSALSMLNRSSNENYASVQWLYDASDVAMNKCKAKIIIGENAPNLFTKMGVNVRESLREIGTKNGYTLSIIKINSILCGVPQSRIRTFFIFWKSDSAPYLNKPIFDNVGLKKYLEKAKINLTYHNVEELEKNLTESPQYKFIKEVKKLPLSEYLNNKNFMQRVVLNDDLDVYGKFLEGTKFQKDINFVKHVKNKLSMGMGYWDNLSFFDTRTADKTNALTGKIFTSLLHPTENRTLSHAELMTLMGLPSDFEILNNNFAHYTQNVTVHAASWVVSEAIKFLDDRLMLSKQNGVVLQDFSSTKKIEEYKNPIQIETIEGVF